MAQIPTIFYSNTLPSGATTVWTSTTKGRIDYCTVYNNTVATVTVSVAIGSLTFVTKVLTPQETYTFPEIINAQIASGVNISVTTSNVGQNLQMSGYLFT